MKGCTWLTLHVTVLLKRSQGGKSKVESRTEADTVGEHWLLACSAVVLIQLGSSCPGMAVPQWALLDQLAVKKILHRHSFPQTSMMEGFPQLRVLFSR